MAAFGMQTVAAALAQPVSMASETKMAIAESNLMVFSLPVLLQIALMKTGEIDSISL